MKIKQRNGALGLETSKAVMVSFLILAITGVAIILALSTLDDAVGDSIDNVIRTPTLSATNESANSVGIAIVYANTTGYTLSGYNSSWSGITATAVWRDGNQTTNTTYTPTGYSVTIPTSNITISSIGVITNASVSHYANASVSYTYVYTYTEDRGRMDSIVGNVTGGIETFFGSTGTIFSILIVVVIILAISIIIWAVGRFGQQTEGSVNL